MKTKVLVAAAVICCWIALEQWYAGTRSWLFLAAGLLLVLLIAYFLIAYLPGAWRHEMEKEGGRRNE